MKDIKFPLLKENQIEVRVGQVSQTGCTLLLYKTSRTDAEILDLVIGAGNWQKKFYTLQGVGIGDRERSIVVCSVGIYDDDKKEWIWKDDSGTESEVEQDKGVCSDAFKRASGGSCWGIGRELYYTGRIFVKVPTKKKENGRGYELEDKYMSFDLKEISWYENPLKLKTIVITDNKGNVVFSIGSNEKVAQTSEKVAKTSNYTDNAPKKELIIEGKTLAIVDKMTILDYLDKQNPVKKASFHRWLQGTYGVDDIADLTFEQGKEVVDIINGK